MLTPEEVNAHKAQTEIVSITLSQSTMCNFMNNTARSSRLVIASHNNLGNLLKQKRPYGRNLLLMKQFCLTQKKAQEDFRDKIRREAPEKKKRNRRTADEIQKKWTCQAPRCQRHYGSEGSLIQHLKLKHPEMYEQLPKKKQEDQEHHQDQSYLSE